MRKLLLFESQVADVQAEIDACTMTAESALSR
jgi:hypothetical protein